MKSNILPLLSITEIDLFKTLCSNSALRAGFKEVKSNKGAAGIDQISIKDFEANLDQELNQLKIELSNWTYHPKPIKRVEIPKPNGGVRLLGIPTIRDRVVQTTIKQLLEPILDPQFSQHSYGFRPDKNQAQAIRAAKEIVKKGKDYIVDLDLSKFFDEINHDLLISRLSKTITDKRILRLIGIILRSGIQIGNQIIKPTKGSPQGSPLSPLLSNVVLDELDKELENRNLEFCRFVDDCNIFAKSQKAANRIMQNISKFIERKLKLKVNQDKSKVAKSDQVKFLGLTIVNHTIAISKKAIDKAMARVKELTPRGTYKALELSIKEINQWYIGWSSYFSITEYPAQLIKIEAHIRRRLRSRIISQQKKRRHLYQKMVKANIVPSRAAKVCYSNGGKWALSHNREVEKWLSNQWFITKGLFIRSKDNQPHWLDLGQWVKLV